MSGAAVKEVQCLLYYRGHGAELGPGGIDGQFGNDTKAAVVNFQYCMGISHDGGVGPQTWPALRSSKNC
jgi:peptidoglycan hydrolase-like protein with peptidoglycan-binding domain